VGTGHKSQDGLETGHASVSVQLSKSDRPECNDNISGDVFLVRRCYNCIDVQSFFNKMNTLLVIYLDYSHNSVLYIQHIFRPRQQKILKAKKE